MRSGLTSQAALDAGRVDEALALAREYLRFTEASSLLGASTYCEALGALAERGDQTAAQELERLRWLWLRWSPRADSGVAYAGLGITEVWAESVYSIVPLLVLTRDFAPADMQYRMHREHLLDPATGRYGERYDVDASAWVLNPPSASGSGWVAAAMARALRLGGDATPREMRGRWQRETCAVLDACDRVDDVEAAPMLAYAAYTGIADGWLSASYAHPADEWRESAREAVTASGRAFAEMARSASARG